MAVVIREVVTEVVLPSVGEPTNEGRPPGEAIELLSEAQVEAIVRRATERVLETLRREWDV